MNIKINLNWGIILSIIFVVLKLGNIIAWSWWWVFSPLLLNTGLAFIFLIVGIIIYKNVNNISYHKNNKRCNCNNSRPLYWDGKDLF